MKRLSGMDASFLYMETANMHMHVGGVFILDPKDVPGGYHFEKVRELLEARLHLLPPFRRRVVKIPFDLHHPLWVEDPEFDLDYHVRRVCLPKPGGRKELANFVAEVIGRPLDLNKPLWEMYVIEGLSDGMIALLPKTHHAAVDGVSGAELAAVLLDMTPEPRYVPPPEQPWKPERIPTDYELVSYAMISLALHPLSAYKAINRTIEMILNIRERNRMLEMLGIKPPPSLFSAPKTRINAAITPHRRFSFTEIDLEDFKFVKNNLGGTVNDTVLCVCASALRKYLTAHNDLPQESLVAMVPISVHTQSGGNEPGNKLSAMLVSLGSDIEDPIERYKAVCKATSDAKEQDRAIGAAALMDFTEFATPALAARAARFVTSRRTFNKLRPMFNVTISNVPGPNFPLYAAGARMLTFYPIGPIVEGMGLNITVMSYMGTLYFGLLACRELMPDLDKFAKFLNQSMRELIEAVKQQAPLKVPAPAKINYAVRSL